MKLCKSTTLVGASNDINNRKMMKCNHKVGKVVADS